MVRGRDIGGSDRTVYTIGAHTTESLTVSLIY